MSEKPPTNHIELFRYYVEQARHTENLWVQISKFFTTLITGLIAATAFILRSGSNPQSVITLMILLSSLGAFVSVFAFVVVLSYQILIREWVMKKHVMEEALLGGSDEAPQSLDRNQLLGINKPKVYIMPMSAGVFLLFALMFVTIITLSLSSPECIRDLVGAGR